MHNFGPGPGPGLCHRLLGGLLRQKGFGFGLVMFCCGVMLIKTKIIPSLALAISWAAAHGGGPAGPPPLRHSNRFASNLPSSTVPPALQDGGQAGGAALPAAGGAA